MRLEAEQLREQLSNEVKAAQAEVRVMMMVMRMILALRIMLSTDQTTTGGARKRRTSGRRGTPGGVSEYFLFSLSHFRI